VSGAQITLLVEDLRQLAGALPESARFPVLEQILARGRKGRRNARTANHVRLELFGARAAGHPPVAALTQLAETGSSLQPDLYWLRADPVTMRADMTRVFITSCGFDGLDAAQRRTFDRVVRDVLEYECIRVPEGQHGPWCFPLDSDPAVDFTLLHEALGMDVAEALPAAGNASPWKRIMTEIQVEFHDRGSRKPGQEGANSVWFWGGGRLPEMDLSTRAFDTVFSDDPVSRGLAVLAGSRLLPLDRADAFSGRVLVDWIPATRDAVRESGNLEQLASGLLETVKGGGSLILIDGGGEFRRVDRWALMRFWLRGRPLAGSFPGEAAG
jgi:hypothetical protein